ncbi:hypothetical protein [Psychroserpens algicola]|uniref:Uncharacterized protein n=1 Tax=Psychroserpens algicola TaxID=1719034 RepID=A0ABT0H3T8_9FLAO|nr:hypothetical protein [Psychroserpens algicola]MCK8479043.1 hypothetical protein [Psychroserpens algicola]
MSIEIPENLSPERNAEFRALYKKHFGQDISESQADEEAYRLLSFFSIVFDL